MLNSSIMNSSFFFLNNAFRYSKKMSIKYVGRTTDFSGKSLWEIVGNLKNYGVGRLVYQQKYTRYPEPCYFKILKVTPIQHDGNLDNPVSLLHFILKINFV